MEGQILKSSKPVTYLLLGKSTNHPSTELNKHKYK